MQYKQMCWYNINIQTNKHLTKQDSLSRTQLKARICSRIWKQHDYYGFDDAFYAACLTLQIMAESGKTCSELFSDIPETFYTPEVKIPVSEEAKFGVVAALQDHFKKELGADRANTIDGIRATWEDGSFELPTQQPT